MAVKIRLMRMGARHQPFYRLVVADSRSPRTGKYIDAIGFYNPTTQPSVINVDEAKVVGWLEKGARPSDAARVVLERSGVLKKWEEKRKGTQDAAAAERRAASRPS
jgi:small subunit ribosomal protein S16